MSATQKPGPDDWRRVNEIFHRALEHPPDNRDAFVREACADNQRLCDEVTSLLDAHDRAGSFIEPESEAARAAVEVSAADAASFVGRMLGHYRIESILGEGGMGVVYLAEDVRLGRTVALKAIAPRYTSNQARRDRLRREARAAAALSHPGIATVYALEELDGQIFIAGEYVPGETLRDELGRGPIAAARAIETAVCVARALAVAHDRGVVHRDLKPENLIRTPAGDVKILDFGLAHMRDAPAALARLTDDGTFLGTPAYMSPEQIRGDPVDGRSDLFSLGIVLYELVSGAHPFAGHDPASTIARILEADPPRLSQVGAGSGADLQMLGELEGIVRTCLRKAPGTRYQSAHELAGALDRMRDGTRPRSAIAPLPIDEPSSRSLARWWWQFHQGAVAGGYSLLMIALWMARGRIGGLPGRLLFLTGLMAVIGAVTLRLHLWFTMRSYPSEWARQHANATGWIRLADAAFVAALLAGGLAVVEADGTLAAVLVGAGVGVLVSFTVIEPATTRAAFRDDGES